MHILRKHSGILVTILLSSIALFPLLHSGLPVMHDGQDHVARIANFYQSLSEGNIIPRWAGNLNWGYGHPILMFLYPFPSYVASFFHFLGFSFIDSLKLVFGLAFIVSGIGMYLWIRNVFGEKAGVLAAVLYMYAPYRFVDLYVRGAVGEHVAFAFVPFVFYFLYKMSRKNSFRHLIGGMFSLTGLLLSHNAIAVIFIPIIFLYALRLVWTSKNKKLLTINYLLFTIFGFGMSAFFIIPAFFEGKYTLRDIVTGHNEYRAGFVKSITDFFIPSWSFGGSQFLSKQIGIVQVVGIISAVLFSVKNRFAKQRSLSAVLMCALFISLILMLPVSDLIWQRVTIIQKFQFPWRFLSVTVFAAAILPVLPFLYVKNKKFLTVYTIALSFLAIALCFPYYQANGYILKPDSFYSGLYKGTTDTGESSPIWSVRFMEHATTFPAEFIDGNGSIKSVFRSSTRHDYIITVPKGNARIRENTLYFPNWEVYINGQKAPIEFQDKENRGLITYYVASKKNDVKIIFKNTKLRNFADLISIISLTAFFGILLFTIFVGKFIKHEK